MRYKNTASKKHFSPSCISSSLNIDGLKKLKVALTSKLILNNQMPMDRATIFLSLYFVDLEANMRRCCKNYLRLGLAWV